MIRGTSLFEPQHSQTNFWEPFNKKRPCMSERQGRLRFQVIAWPGQVLGYCLAWTSFQVIFRLLPGLDKRAGWVSEQCGAASKGRVHAELDITRVAHLHKLTPDQENILYYTLSYDISSHITIHISLYIIMLLICTSSQTILLTIGPLDHVLFPASIFFQFFDMLQIDYWQTCCNYIVTNMFQIDC